MKFVFEHPDIAMIVSFGSTNFCLTPPKGDRKGEADLEQDQILGKTGQAMFDLDPDKNLYHRKSWLILSEAANPEMNVDESMIAGLSGIWGQHVNPQAGDLIFYEQICQRV